MAESLDRGRSSSRSIADSYRDFHERILGSLGTAFDNDRRENRDSGDDRQVFLSTEPEVSGGTKYAGEVRVAGWARRLAECEKADARRFQGTYKPAPEGNKDGG